jgi:hypothetical protein
MALNRIMGERREAKRAKLDLLAYGSNAETNSPQLTAT